MNILKRILAFTFLITILFSFTTYAKTSRVSMENSIKATIRPSWGEQGKGWDMTYQNGFYFITLYDYDGWLIFMKDVYGKGRNREIHNLANECAFLINNATAETLDTIKKAGYNDSVAISLGKDKDHIVYCSLDGYLYYDARYN